MYTQMLVLLLSLSRGSDSTDGSPVGRLTGQWLRSAANGYCGQTVDGDPGNCERGHQGSYHLRSSVARTWVLALRVCISHCLSCGRCNYISVSLKRKDCSWFHRCSMKRLHREADFRTARVAHLEDGKRAGRWAREVDVRSPTERCPSPADAANEQGFAAMVSCLQGSARPQVEATRLGELMRHHLWTQPTVGAPCRRRPLGELGVLDLTQLDEKTRGCVRAAGDSMWTADGPADPPSSACGRRWRGTVEARCLFANMDVVFMGNSVTRRQMYTVLDLLAGPKTHRQRSNDLETISEVANATDPREANLSWVWDVASKTDSDAAKSGYHGAQLVTIDLDTGEQRFHLPHRLCGLTDTFSTFNVGRLRQWRFPGRLGSDDMAAQWRTTKWFQREWKPVVSLIIEWPRRAARGHEECEAASDGMNWAGSFPLGVQGWPLTAQGRNQSLSEQGSFSSRARRALLHAVGEHFGWPEWMGSVSVQTERPLPGRQAAGSPNAWVFFPTFHGEREKFNGFCEDKPCNCTYKLPKCHRHPQCRGKHMCAPQPEGSAVSVDRALDFASTLRKRGTLLGRTISSVRVSPFYDDCWENRGRCQGNRPCPEPVDAATACRATAFFCPRESWPSVLARAKGRHAPLAHTPRTRPLTHTPSHTPPRTRPSHPVIRRLLLRVHVIALAHGGGWHRLNDDR